MINKNTPNIAIKDVDKKTDKTLFDLSLNINAVKHLKIYHLDDDITTPVAVRPQWIEASEIVRHFETADPKDIQHAYAALSNDKPTVDLNGRINTRWGIKFLDGEQKPVLLAYTDQFGSQGEINQTRIHFTNGTFLEWLRRRFLYDTQDS